MNKHDIILCLVLFIISGSLYGLYILTSKKATNAKVYYNNSLILNIDLSKKEDNYYTVTGYNGEVKIEAMDGKVRVVDEISPKHLCSKEGWISNSYESIICLPNKIVINIEGSTDVDTIAR